MLLRPTVLALALVVGATAAAPAQSNEYPFRRFRLQTTPHLRFSTDKIRDLKSIDKIRDLRGRVDLRQKLEVARSLATRERARDRQWDRDFALRNRRFEMQDRAHQRALELKLRGLDRFKDRFDHFKFERPFRIKRHSRII
jgi:hypothetical protein